MARQFERQWPEIRRFSRSQDEFHRTTALAMAVGCLEKGLAALGFQRQEGEGIQKRLRRARFTDFKGAPEPNRLKSAIGARNHAVHEHTVGAVDDCNKHIGILYRAWCALRKAFVTRENAALLAKAILQEEGISDVFLFGSLATPKRGRDPRDIDLLLFDSGDYSYWLNQYGPENVWEDGFLETQAEQAAIRCGWLDYTVVDGRQFGKDPTYTLSLAQSQPDPLFFVNISASLRTFDPSSSKKWSDKRPQVFARLAALRKQLEIESIVASAGLHRGRARRRRRRPTSA